jgi:hypothetical protein
MAVRMNMVIGLLVGRKCEKTGAAYATEKRRRRHAARPNSSRLGTSSCSTAQRGLAAHEAGRLLLPCEGGNAVEVRRRERVARVDAREEEALPRLVVRHGLRLEARLAPLPVPASAVMPS